MLEVRRRRGDDPQRQVSATEPFNHRPNRLRRFKPVAPRAQAYSDAHHGDAPAEPHDRQRVAAPKRETNATSRALAVLELRGGRPFSTLWTTRPGSTHMGRVTHSKFNVWAPAISPDGKPIAFDRVAGAVATAMSPFADPDGTHISGRFIPVREDLLVLRRDDLGARRTDAPRALMATGVKPHLKVHLVDPLTVRTDASSRSRPVELPRGLTITIRASRPTEPPSSSTDPTKRPGGITPEIRRSTGDARRSPFPTAPTRVIRRDARRVQDPLPVAARAHAGVGQNFYTIRPDGTGLRRITHYPDLPARYVGVSIRAFPDGPVPLGLRASSTVRGARGLTNERHRILSCRARIIENDVVWGRLG